MPFHKSGLVFLAVTCFGHVALGDGPPPRWENPEGGNMILMTSKERISWGDQNPGDVILNHLHDMCVQGHCSTDPLTINTQVVIKGKNVRKNLVVEVKQSTIPLHGPGTPGPLLAALEGVLRDPQWATVETVHWDQQSQMSSCPNPMNNNCAIPVGDYGDIPQYNAPHEIGLTYAVEKADEFADVLLSIKTVDENGSAWDCQKLFDTAGAIAGMMKGVPGAGFTLGSLLCGIFASKP